jgi:multidrug efflux pump subunit AcrA (membrane-fusion protein)
LGDNRQGSEVTVSDGEGELFRKQALDHHAGVQEYSGVLRLSPSWTRWTLALVLGASVFYVGFALFGRLSVYATGPAVVRMADRIDLTAADAGQVLAVEVQPGQRVEAGQVLVRLSDDQERAELERFQREFELLLIRRMQNLSDEGARQSLGALRAQRELAESRLEQRMVRAPHAGVVSDVRLRPGQHVTSGEALVSLVGDDSAAVVTAMLPGEYRPLLSVGAPLRLELRGFPYAYQELAIEAVGDELVGPNEVRRYLGPEVAESVEVHGAVVLVRARLPARTFDAEGRRLTYFDGMPGTAQVRVTSERILLSLVPGLKALLP